MAGKKRKNIPTISDAEWTVMEVLWSKTEGTANQVVDALDGQVDWKPKTIQTLLRRLVEKEALTYDKQGREFVFQPLVSADECRHEASKTFMNRVFKGQFAPLLSCFVENQELSPEEIEELKRILDGKTA